MPSDWHVYLCLDGITKNTLDCTHRRTDGQLRFFLYSFLEYLPHSVLKLFMSAVFLIFQVAFLYLADWYVRPDIVRTVPLQLTSTSYNIYASSAQAGQSLFRTSSKLGRLNLYISSFRIHRSFQKETQWPVYFRFSLNKCLPH